MNRIEFLNKNDILPIVVDGSSIKEPGQRSGGMRGTDRSVAVFLETVASSWSKNPVF